MQEVPFVPSGWPFVVLFGFVKAKVRLVIQEKDMTKSASTRKTTVKTVAVQPVPYNEFRAASVVLGYKTMAGSSAVTKLVKAYQTSGIPANVKAAVMTWAEAGNKKVWGKNTEPGSAPKAAAPKATRTSTRTVTKAKAEATVAASGFTEAQIAEIAQVIKAVLAAS